MPRVGFQRKTIVMTRVRALGLAALLSACGSPPDRPQPRNACPPSPLAYAASGYSHRVDYVTLTGSSAHGTALVTPPPPPSHPKPAPPVARPNALRLSPPLSMAPLNSEGSLRQPWLYVPIDTLAGHRLKTCRAQYYGLYRQDRKVGWERSTCSVRSLRGDTLLALRREGQETAFSPDGNGLVHYREERVWSLTAPGNLRWAERVERRGKQKRTVSLRPSPKGWQRIEDRRRPGRAPEILSRRVGQLRLPVSSSAPAVRTALVTGLLTQGHPVRVHRLDLLRGRDTVWLLQVHGTGTRRLRGVPVPLIGLSWLRLLDEHAWEATRDTEGDLLLLEPEEDGLRRIREARSTYRLGVGAHPLFALGAIYPAPNEDLGDQETIDRLNATIRGPNTPFSHRPTYQTLRRTGSDLARLTVVRAPWKTQGSHHALYGLPVPRARLASWLQDRPELGINQPEIRAKARAIIRGMKKALKAGLAIGQFVHGRLRKSISMDLGTAREVLRAGAGDSPAHALLMVALCRAGGVPARRVSGLVWEPSMESFVVDTWVEIAAGPGLIVPMDPARNEFPAQATHIALGAPLDLTWRNALAHVSIELPTSDPPPEQEPAPR